MLQIGEFSRLSRISVRMLRHYDQVGLLKPAEQDAQTGYRRYAVSQLAEANRITVLRDLGFPIREIGRLAHADDGELARALDDRARELEEGIGREQRRLADLRRFRQEVEAGGAAVSCEVTLVSVPPYQVVALRMELADYDEERRAWERLGALMGERGITPSEPYTEYCEFCNEGAGSGSSGRAGDDTAVVVEVAVATDAHGEDDGPLCFYRSAALPLAASIKVYGPYENIAPVYASFARWLEDHPALRMAGPTCEVAHRGPWNADDPQDYLTEFLVPVRKTA
ncbi:MAG: MerR family transcriptional regulator [Gordonibacter pamelaeae]|uniref:Predicted transcriptional regulators n=2 Tax=Gordonibacter pamelaeae TaxID=471189 RepID=D6E8U4_9ACTN|nr:MerR family transcriptional regulator [Gordonibacter pamelaeae]MBS4896195.1 MerR family transcriptional regulator [Gordonibacter pamelaeae]MCB6311167.1 MerR family transcriptional regulator [Gordonibacter pamelaeae]CBL04141.1 Predicted transcriptional regulators [Gordonibacter pamelaeae 7-10-1-b]HJH73080.1 MerR family transcriptional regulator [Eggerthellaceae bacterium]